MKIHVIEEHNELFELIVRKNPSTKTLLHIDAHEDITAPYKFRHSIHELLTNQTLLKRFAKEEINIASFVQPLALIGKIDEIYCLLPLWRKNKNQKKEKTLNISTLNGEGKIVQTQIKKKPEVIRHFFPDIKHFKYHLINRNKIPKNMRVILDIDLDYFSCVDNPFTDYEQRIEITRQEYEKAKKSDGSIFNFYGMANKAIKIKDKYYYVLSFFPEKRKEFIKEKEEIIREIESLFSALKKQNIKPELISVCRSRGSGYTPRDQCAFIEKEVIKKIKETYPPPYLGNEPSIDKISESLISFLKYSTLKSTALNKSLNRSKI